MTVGQVVELPETGAFYVVYKWPLVPASGELATPIAPRSAAGAVSWNHGHTLFAPRTTEYWTRLRVACRPFSHTDAHSSADQERMRDTHLVFRLMKSADARTRNPELDEEVGCAFVDISVLALEAFGGVVDGWYDVVDVAGKDQVRCRARCGVHSRCMCECILTL